MNKPAQYKRPESVLVLMQNQHGLVLVMQRDDDASFWQSVTGTIEEGEQAIQCAYREVREETGIDLQSISCALTDHCLVNTYKIREDWRVRYAPGTLYNEEHVFSVVIPNGLPITLTEHLAYEWLPISEAIDKVWSPTNKEAIEKFALSDIK